jgi:hypothetical protein
VAQDMLIEHVTYHQSENTTCNLELVDPRAYGGKSGKGNKSDKSWNMDNSDAS